MNTRLLIAAIGLTGLAMAQDAPLPQPAFHHLHLNSPDPEVEIAFYAKNFTSAHREMFDGQPALKAGPTWLLFNKVAAQAPHKPQSAIWHYGWNVPDERAYLAKYHEMGTKILPLWTGEGDNFVQVSSDSYPGAGGTLGRTRAQLEEAKAQGVKPAGGAGFGYLAAPDGAMIEFAGNFPREYFNHVHMYQDQPLCAALWYQKHLNVPARPARGNAPQPTEENCATLVPRGEKTWPALEKDGMYRAPTAGIQFGEVSMMWYIRPGDTPLASTLGQQADHIAFSVADLDAWLKKLKSEGVKVLKEPYKFANTRAFMIEGPSKEALELVEVK